MKRALRAPRSTKLVGGKWVFNKPITYLQLSTATGYEKKKVISAFNQWAT